MPTVSHHPTIRVAVPADAMAITMLYQQVYQGNYSNPLMRDINQLSTFLADPSNLWVVAEEKNRIVGSVVHETDAAHRVARAFGGAVLPEYRGSGLLEKTMVFAEEQMMTKSGLVDLVYATTRTSTPAAQIVTERLGYKKLGIFPNVHRTDVYETHCLTVLFGPDALQKRFTSFRMHPRIAPLFDIARDECALAPVPLATPEDLHLDAFDATIDLELIPAEKYALHRFQLERDEGILQAHFYPFHSPNMVISSPCQSVEIFLFSAGADKYCTIIGVKKPREYNFTSILESCVKILQAAGVRYVETLVRADKVKTLERVLQARFIPCAYFPAFQLNGADRHDFVVLSRTFEIVDFRNLRLAGKNNVYLEEYLKNLHEYFLKPQLSRP